MSEVLRVIGYRDGPAALDEWPDVCGFVRPGDSAAHRAVAAYLRSGTVFAVTAGVSMCRLCGAANGSAELADGTHFTWPEGLAHDVQEHHGRSVSGMCGYHQPRPVDGREVRSRP